MFFSDFTVFRPKYKKGDGSEKEAADILVPFGKSLLVFQVKSKLEHKKASEKSELDLARINKVVKKAIAQFKTIKRVIKNKWIESFTTLKGYEIKFPFSDLKEIIGIVIVDLIGEEKFPKNERTEFAGNYVFEHSIPIHVFMRSEFDALSYELDTLPDFIRFLEKRKTLFERGLILPNSSVLDFLAIYKTNPDKVDQVIDNHIHLFVDQGIWDYYRETHTELIEHRDKLNEPSYLIDEIIDYLHTSVGFTFPENILEDSKFPWQGSLEGYLEIARELASLPRLERRIIGEKYLNCMKRADNQDYSYSMSYNEKDESAILVLSFSGDRTKRQICLYRLCAMAYSYLDLKRITGIATEPLSELNRSYDAICLNKVKFLNNNELAEQAIKFFGKPYKLEITEY